MTTDQQLALQRDVQTQIGGFIACALVAESNSRRGKPLSPQDASARAAVMVDEITRDARSACGPGALCVDVFHVIIIGACTRILTTNGFDVTPKAGAQ